MSDKKAILSAREALLIKTPGITKVEVYAFRDDKIIKLKETMSFEEFLDMPKMKGWKYQTYEPGFCRLIPTQILEKK